MGRTLTEKESREIGDRVLSSGEFPSAGNPTEVGEAVYALQQHSAQAREAWVRAMDTNRRFYNGDQIKVRRTSPNIVDNQVRVAVGTVRPRIQKSVRDIEIRGVDEASLDAVEALSLRVEHGCRRSYLQDLALPEAIDNMLIEGGAILKVDSSVMISVVDPKTIFWTPETGFDEAWYVGQHSLMTVGELRLLFGKAVVGAGTVELEAKAGERDAPPMTTDDAGTNLIVSMAAVGETAPVRRYSTQALGGSFVKAERVWVIELWVRDMTMRGGELVYPSGRLINVAIGVDSGRLRVKDEIEVVLDRPMPFERLNAMTGRFHPFAYAPYDNRRGVWSVSLVTDLIPLQRGLNDAWNTWIKNAKLVNNPRMLAHASLGLKAGSVTNQAGEITNVPAEYNYPANTALTFLQVPSIAQHFVPIREAFLRDIRDLSGIMDVVRGENPTGVTAGVALNVLDSNANERISAPARSLSLALAQTKENMAYIAQELDSGAMVIPDDNVETEREMVEYDPDVAREAQLMVTSVEKLPIEKVATIMTLVADLEAKGMPGELVLRYVDDPRLYRIFIEKKRERALAEQLSAVAEEQAAAGQADAEMGRQIQGKIADVAFNGGRADAVRK